jgi:hypothetical protein
MGNKNTVGVQHPTNKVYTQNGLLYKDRIMIDLPEADFIAQEHGFMYAEQLVRQLEKEGRTKLPTFITDD